MDDGDPELGEYLTEAAEEACGILGRLYMGETEVVAHSEKMESQKDVFPFVQAEPEPGRLSSH